MKQDYKQFCKEYENTHQKLLSFEKWVKKTFTTRTETFTHDLDLVAFNLTINNIPVRIFNSFVVELYREEETVAIKFDDVDDIKMFLIALKKGRCFETNT